MSKSKHANNYTEAQFTLSSSAIEIASQKASRTGLVLFNTGANLATISIGSRDIPISAGDHIAFVNYPPLNAITAKSSSGTTLVVWEA